jgi:uncharacterized protein (TIGR02246 family)
MPLKILSDFAETFETAFNAGDIDGLLALYSDDIVAVPIPGTHLSGKEELEGALGHFLGLPGPRVQFATDAIVEGKDTALLDGSWVFDAAPEGDEDPTHIEARAVLAFTQKDDGWYVVLDDFFGQG